MRGVLNPAFVRSDSYGKALRKMERFTKDYVAISLISVDGSFD